MLKPKVAVEQTLFVAYDRSRQGKKVTVTKLGRKYFSTSDNRQWQLDNWQLKSDFRDARLWESEAAFLAAKLLNRRWSQLKAAINTPYNPTLTLDQTEQVLTWLGVNLEQ